MRLAEHLLGCPHQGWNILVVTWCVHEVTHWNASEVVRRNFPRPNSGLLGEDHLVRLLNEFTREGQVG